MPNELPDQAGAVRDLVAAMKRSPTSETRTADLVPRAWIPGARGRAAAARLHARAPGAGAGRRSPACCCRPRRADGPAADRGRRGRSPPAIPTRAAAEFLKEAGAGRAEDTAFYNAGTAALEAGRLDVARGALAEAAKSLDPGAPLSRALQPGPGRPARRAGRHAPARTSCSTTPPTGCGRRCCCSLRPHGPSGTSSSPSGAGRRLRRRVAAGAAAAAAAERRRRSRPSSGRPSPSRRDCQPEPGGADPQLDGAAGAADPRGAAAPHADRLGRRSEGLVSAAAPAPGRGLRWPAARASGPQLEASVDEDRVSVGEELTYTLRAVSHSPAPMQVTLAPFNGLEIVGAERAHRGGARRRPHPHDGARDPAARRAARPLADRPGPGDAGARYGRGGGGGGRRRRQPGGHRHDAESAPPTAARARAAAAARAAGGRPARVDRHACGWASRWTWSPPPGSRATSGCSFAARRRCSRRSSTACGAIPQATPSGIAATRNIRGRWYDLFVVAPGRLSARGRDRSAIPRATLKYSTPGRAPVLQPGGALRAVEPGRHAGRAPAARRGTARGLRRRDRLGAHGSSAACRPAGGHASAKASRSSCA